MRVVVGSCVALKWFVLEYDTRTARGLLASGVDQFAPDFLLVELANALWKSERLLRLDRKDAEMAIAAAPRYFTEFLPSAELVPEAAALALSIDHPVYDCLYIVASRRTHAKLVTTDRRLIARLAGTDDADRVVDLADWRPGG